MYKTNKTKTFDPKEKDPDVYSEIEEFLQKPEHYLENVEYFKNFCVQNCKSVHYFNNCFIIKK